MAVSQLSIHSTPTGQALSVLLWEDVNTYDIVCCPEPRCPKCLPLISLHVSRMSASFYFGGFGGSWPAIQPHPSPSTFVFQGSCWESPCNLLFSIMSFIYQVLKLSVKLFTKMRPDLWGLIFCLLPLLTLHYIAYVDFIILHCLKVAVCSPIWDKSRAILYPDLLWTKPVSPTKRSEYEIKSRNFIGGKGRGRVRRGNVSGITINRPKES